MFRSQLPRPPRRHCTEGSASGGIGDPNPNRPRRSKDGGNGSTSRIRPYYFRKCKKAYPTNIDFLPDELLSQILLLLSAQDIYEKARLVCRRWSRIIHGYDFVHSHLQHTSNGLLFRHAGGDLHFMAATKGGIEFSKLNYKISFRRLSSCNGLVVGFEYSKENYPYIVNPATNSSFILPRIFDRSWRGYVGIGYAAASMEYKVVLTYKPHSISILSECAILTVGVDQTWRRVATDGIPPFANVLSQAPMITTPGFMHWVSPWSVVLTLNVETEVITETHVPLSHLDYVTNFYYLSTGKYLTLLLYCKNDNYLWELWEMKPETGEWRKLPRCIDLEAHKHRIHQYTSKDRLALLPVGWVKYPEVLAFFFYGDGRSCIIYNLDRDEVDCIQMPDPCVWYNVVLHRNSLVWLR